MSDDEAEMAQLRESQTDTGPKAPGPEPKHAWGPTRPKAAKTGIGPTPKVAPPTVGADDEDVVDDPLYRPTEPKPKKARIGPQRPGQMGPPRPARDKHVFIPRGTAASASASEDGSGGADDEKGWMEREEVPLSRVHVLRGHTRGVTAMSLDPSGSRLVTGSSDYYVKFWDFAGMDVRGKSFRSIEPSEGHAVNHLAFSPTGDRFLVSTVSPTPRLYDRDGVFIVEFIKGDPYIMDMGNTNGHVSPLTSIMWHPTKKEMCITSATDSSIRLWHIDRAEQKHTQVIRAKNQRNLRVPVTACTVLPDMSWICAGCMDGSLQLWPGNGPFHRPRMLLRNAHDDQYEISSVNFHPTNHHMLATRSCDDTLKLWDLRKFTSPLQIHKDLWNLYPETDVIFSPDGLHYATATSANPHAKAKGAVVMYRVDTMKEVGRVTQHNPNVAPGANKSLSQPSGIRILWHPKINQIITGWSDADVRVFYDPTISVKGAIMSAGKAVPKRRANSDVLATDDMRIYTPNSDIASERPQFNPRREKNLARKDPVKSKRPALPVDGAGKEGRLGSSMNSYLVQRLTSVDTRILKDARDAILEHDDEEKLGEEAGKITGAYSATQPKPIFDTTYLEEEEEEGDAGPV